MASNFICINFLIDYKTIIDLHVTNESNESTTDFFFAMMLILLRIFNE